MKAAVTDYVGAPFTLQEIEIAAPEGREVLNEVRASGLCHSDLHVSATDVGFPVTFFVARLLLQDMGVLAGRFRHGFCPQSPMIRGVLPPEPTWRPGKR